GIVVQAGEAVTSLTAGDAVIGFNLDGAYASHLVAPAAKFVRKPESLGWEEAAGFGVPGGTAYQALKSLRLAAGEAIVIHGASGAVGQMAVQLARLWGATVIGTASAPNHARLSELGAIPVAYGEGL